VESDLQAAGLIRDPMIGANVWDMRPYEGYQWCYVRSFPTPEFQPDQKVFLWFGGIDCLADIWLNGTKVGSTENMLIEHSFDVTGLLEKGKDNELQVIIRSAVIEAQNYFIGALVNKGGGSVHVESVNIRKAAHSFGWDIMPRLVSAGLWRNVELRIVDPVRLADVHWMTAKTDVENRSAEVIVEYQLKIPFDRLSKYQAVISLKRNGKEVYRNLSRVITFAARQMFTLNNVDLWWPRGYGEPALYEAELSIVDENGNILTSDRKNIGLRTVSLDYTELTTPENPGEFCFKVNGEKIFIKGSNWVPQDALHSRDGLHLSQIMKMAVDLNCNMLRCWGGNVYEDHAFYDLCDQNGILVWQDFAMGCTIPPQTDDFADKIREEVASVVIKLRNHPSIALWAGNNENDESLLWQLSDFSINPNKERISRSVIPEVLFELDPSRTYLPSSPYYSQAYYDAGRNVDLLPERHLWGPRGYYKASFYTNTNALFVSEIGYHGCPNRESLEKMFDKDFVYPWKKGTFEWNEQWQTKAVRVQQYSDTQDRRNDLMLNQIKELFGEVPTDLDRFIFASQAVQAEADKFFIEFWRSAKFKRTGILWWNLHDGWPIISDAVTDYYFGKKMAYYYIKRVQYDACVMITDAVEGKHPVVAVNDTRIEKQGTVVVKDIDTKKVLLSDKFSIPVNGKTIIGYIPQSDKQSMWLIEYTIGNEKFINHYLAGKAPFRLNDYERWHKLLEQRIDGDR
jgi:beta-mannosidase